MSSWIEYIPRVISILFDVYFVYKDPHNNDKAKRLSKNIESAFDLPVKSDINANINSNFFTEDELKNKKDTETEDESVQCKICFVNKRSIVLIPCAHSEFCIECTSQLVKDKKPCPTCRKEFSTRVFYYA